MLDGLKEFLEEAELQQYYDLFRDILKVTKVSQLKFVATEDLVQIGLSKPEQRRYKKIYTKYFPNPYISKIKKLLSSKRNEAFPHAHGCTPADYQPFTENNVKVPTKHIISVEDITINKELGMGQFGVVQQGTWNTGSQRLQVAIKCLGHERMTSNSTEFLKEAAVMHSIEHPNIVRLYGVVLHLDSLMLVTELAPLRSLLECLREIQLRTSFPVPNLCEFAEQICEGMTYLENKRLIHRDLAARNILVFSKDRVKISDFGLSRALGVGKDYYQTNYNVNLKLPVAWCAPECILYLRFTSSSDVWAFGVCLWEMFTYGFQPWAAFSGQQILEAIDAPNFQRLERPECCPEEYYSTMLQCWSHDPNERPKFKDLGLKLREIRPEQVQATDDFQNLEDGRRANFLEFKSGQIITVIGKEIMTKSTLWYGVLPGGACGMFDPTFTKPYSKTDKSLYSMPVSLTPHLARNSSRSIRSTLLRSDLKRHTYTGKRTIQRSMISSPQGDVKHTGHVGLDGAYFGDISFLDPAGCPPRQIVTPYKPSEDLEQVPLINPNSPSHLTGAGGISPYPLLTSSNHRLECKSERDEVDLNFPELRTKSLKKSCHKLEPSTGKSLLNKVKSATLGRGHKTENLGAIAKTYEVHEYHEISDTDTESTATENMKVESLALPESPGIPKSTVDFSQSLLDEMESMFRSLDGHRREDTNATCKHFDIDSVLRSQTLKHEKKKGFHTGTMKPMSAHDQKTLDTACAMANEITTKSMNDLDTDSKLPNSPSEKSKFHFKFPLVHLHHHSAPNEPESNPAGKQERRNFSEEANSVPDIQSTLTEESKLAYASLIEQPTPSSSLISQISKDSNGIHQPSNIPKPARAEARQQFLSLQKQLPQKLRSKNMENEKVNIDDSKNELPLPPRTTKPKLVDKPRHVRKHPLKMPNTLLDRTPGNEILNIQTVRSNIYQNTNCATLKYNTEKLQIQNEKNGVDVLDATDTLKVDTNPFTNNAASSSSSSVNPFSCYLEPLEDPETEDNAKVEGEQYFQEGSLVKDCTDHVSVEDLLEFADQKPCGRQRGVESDEVRIMCKVLKQKAAPEEYLEALELSDWNVHNAIKVMRVKTTAGQAALEDCHKELLTSGGDVVKASAALVIGKKAQ
ncbi:activated Cdc42 kinase-like isoform X2 [Hyposmocoma kahamanoa]|uniref:activated Cdc42 kinase-like isoform X2 n=1 Tax=Hyposmocoma kahamanoa TaxID=1477025 RepID=UPI000E6D8673|nr:activated Cdc42 kinase-like isoform X2 [Hyposmocoma kahamanoa]